MADIPTLKEAEADLIARALKKADGDQAQAAKILGITPAQLKKKLSE